MCVCDVHFLLILSLLTKNYTINNLIKVYGTELISDKNLCQQQHQNQNPTRTELNLKKKSSTVDHNHKST